MSDITLPPELAAIYDRLAQIGQRLNGKSFLKAIDKKHSMGSSLPKGLILNGQEEEQIGAARQEK